MIWYSFYNSILLLYDNYWLICASNTVLLIGLQLYMSTCSGQESVLCSLSSHGCLQTVCHEHYTYRTDQRTNVTSALTCFIQLGNMHSWLMSWELSRGLMSPLQFTGSHRSKRSKTDQFKKSSSRPVSYKTHEVTTSTALQAQTESVLISVNEKSLIRAL